ncbi:unnamed protein product [Nyctereutes procyonoides]|uniref:(raccoon dog) hypothetical protein n=1 Tax=Nyctereutes procyonoides TaxID=34880 RepID=A0A811Y8F9_NYCPR|nr:unnamed protein product [Nyctereutes procyonoides]
MAKLSLNLTNLSTDILPVLVDECIASRIHIVKNKKQKQKQKPNKQKRNLHYDKEMSEFEITPEVRRITKLDQILLNGNNITVLVPREERPEV